jgi:hypothetical protein
MHRRKCVLHKSNLESANAQDSAVYAAPSMVLAAVASLVLSIPACENVASHGQPAWCVSSTLPTSHLP